MGARHRYRRWEYLPIGKMYWHIRIGYQCRAAAREMIDVERYSVVVGLKRPHRARLHQSETKAGPRAEWMVGRLELRAETTRPHTALAETCACTLSELIFRRLGR